jgi:hypothetical protein
MAVRLIDIERALDELVLMEEGKRFQRMAVILQQRRWPELIAHEPKKDDGLDAYAAPSVSGDGTGRGVACSTTPTLGKVSGGCEKSKGEVSWSQDADIRDVRQGVAHYREEVGEASSQRVRA